MNIEEMRGVAESFRDAIRNRELRNEDTAQDYSDACDAEDDAKYKFIATFNPAVVLRLLDLADAVDKLADYGPPKEGSDRYKAAHMALRSSLDRAREAVMETGGRGVGKTLEKPSGRTAPAVTDDLV